QSLGLQPTTVKALLEQELEAWAHLGVEGHFRGRNPWYGYHEIFREPAARLVGAHPGEVVVMNSLTVNLHLMMATFYRPTPGRAAAAHRHGCVAGFDLAHAAGNVVLRLHDWQVDFAVWCNYKYLNSGPGAVGSCFVHEKHGRNLDLPRLAGWWGNDPRTRFRMHLQPEFVPQPGADG